MNPTDDYIINERVDYFEGESTGIEDAMNKLDGGVKIVEVPQASEVAPRNPAKDAYIENVAFMIGTQRIKPDNDPRESMSVINQAADRIYRKIGFANGDRAIRALLAVVTVTVAAEKSPEVLEAFVARSNGTGINSDTTVERRSDITQDATSKLRRFEPIGEQGKDILALFGAAHASKDREATLGQLFSKIGIKILKTETALSVLDQAFNDLYSKPPFKEHAQEIAAIAAASMFPPVTTQAAK
jgi:hypothetical protein